MKVIKVSPILCYNNSRMVVWRINDLYEAKFRNEPGLMSYIWCRDIHALRPNVELCRAPQHAG